MKKFLELIELFETVSMTILSGIFLLLSFILSVTEAPFLPDPAWVSVIISGTPLVFSAMKKLVFNSGISKISSALLISIAMLAAIFIGDLFAAGEVAFIMAIGEILEDKTTERAKKGLKKLISLAPERGRLISGSEEKLIPANQIKVGDILRVLPGEAIPVDGEIIAGETSVDQSVITGESLPVDKSVGDSVFCGTINRFGSVDIRTAKVGNDSSLAKLIRMVNDAEEKKAPMQRTADKWASILVPVALFIAIISLLITHDPIRAVTVLVVFCPCALVLATPTAIMAAVGQATKHGVIIKSGEALENMGKVSVIAFDKTGTLTLGRLSVSDIIPLSDAITPDDLISVASSAESRSEHPLAKAIIAYADEKKITYPASDSFTMEAGKGVSVKINQTDILCGNRKYINEKNIVVSQETEKVLSALQSSGKASVLVAQNNVLIGIIGLSDTLKPNTDITISKLTALKTRSLLLTGDTKKAGDFFAEQVGIKDVLAELLPEEKVSAVKNLQSKGETVCMIGDGVNDAPALKTADVGVAMGAMGSDIAADAADIALMTDDISKLPYLKRLSIATLRTIRFSIALSLVINFLAIILSLLGLLTPTTGALVHNAGSVFVVLIATLLYDRKIPE